MRAAKYNIVIEQGADFTWLIQWTDSAGTPHDLTGYSARMKVKLSKDHAGNIYSWTSGSELTITAATGLITIDVAASAINTGISTTPFTRAVYDLELVDGSSNVVRLVEGSVTLSKEVTS